jgi:hypothetical protein
VEAAIKLLLAPLLHRTLSFIPREGLGYFHFSALCVVSAEGNEGHFLNTKTFDGYLVFVHHGSTRRTHSKSSYRHEYGQIIDLFAVTLFL